ncbi:CAIB/BAIF family enzyme [Coprinopsis sp. MPI-PUGE-AT-0042]|nr:CAIB/BAIF family enzyme [Coprinopsis sp. MPI-PUGE-AT-0042]
MTNPPTYSVPEEAKKLLWDGILHNPLHTGSPIEELQNAAHKVVFVGNSSVPVHINWRFPESIAAIKGFQAAMLNILLRRKYEIDYQNVVIDTDHAQLFVMSVFLPVVDPEGDKVEVIPSEAFHRYFPDLNIHKQRLSSPCTNIYRTKDNRFYHLHGSVNHVVSQQAIGATEEEEYAPFDEGRKAYQRRTEQWNASELDHHINEKHRQAGTICLTREEYLASEHGKANAHVGLYELHHVPNPNQLPGWWRAPESSGPARPLLGLKVVDLTRMIASPVVCRELAELGASVLRITSPNITDLAPINVDMHWGKWNAHLDLTKEEDRTKLKELIEEADVVVDGYRPGVMQKWGFGKDDILGFFKDKERGIIYAHENCYGWNGPLSHRSGWQQISDAICGTSYGFGKAMGLDEPVTPALGPDIRTSTGAAGAVGILEALIKKAETGGSYVVDIALNYYSQWLVNSVGTYPPDVWDEVWSRFGRPVYRHWDSMAVTIPAYTEALKKAESPVLNPEFFEDRENKAIGKPIRTGYNIGTRPNGVDKPHWPKDLMTEIIA